jgi:hypothetical protein
MSSKLTALTETTLFGDSDDFYIVRDPGGSPLSRRLTALTMQRYLPMAQNAMSGLGLANNVSDANNDIDIAAGRAGAGTGDYNLILAAAITKQLDANWAVGTNQGGLDTGSKANSTWYHVWVIGRVDTHVVDVLFSTSATAPTMPANYTKKRRIGAIKTNSSGNIIAFVQYGDEFMWFTPPALDVDVTNLGATKANYVLASVPTGVIVKALFNMVISGAAIRSVYISNPDLDDANPSTTVSPLAQITSVTTNTEGGSFRAWTNTSAQISAESTGATTTWKVAVLGWEDPRGKR